MPQTKIRADLQVAVEGAPYDGTGRVSTAINQDPQAKQVDTITVDTATDTETYGIDFFDGAISFSIVASASVAATVAQQLVDEINSDGEDAPLINGRVIATRSGDDVVLTAVNGGVGFTAALDENAGKMTLVNTTANATADPIEFGLLIVGDGQNTINNQVGGGTGFDRLGKLASAANLTAQVDTLLLVYDAGVIAKVAVKVYDPATGITDEYEVEHVMASNADASIVILSGFLNDVLPANTVLSAHPVADTLTLTSEIAGVSFELSFGFGTGLDTGVWTHGTNALTAATDVNRAALGLAQVRQRTEKVRPLTPGAILSSASQYEANENMDIREDGRTWVKPEGTPTIAGNVFVRLVANGSLDRLGGFAGAPGTGLVKLNGASWFKVANEGFAVLELRN